MKNNIYSKFIILLALVLCLSACDGAVHLPESVTPVDPPEPVVVTFKITFNANGGTGSMEEQIVEQDEETKLSVNVFNRNYYSFDGWNTKADGTGTSYTDEQKVTISENLTLYAKWKAQKFTITYLINSDEHIKDTSYPLEYEYGIGATLPTEVTKDAGSTLGYSFIGWFNEGDNPDDYEKRVYVISAEDNGNKRYIAYFMGIK